MRLDSKSELEFEMSYWNTLPNDTLNRLESGEEKFSETMRELLVATRGGGYLSWRYRQGRCWPAVLVVSCPKKVGF